MYYLAMFNLSFFYKYIGTYILFLQFSKEKFVYAIEPKLNQFIIYFDLKNIIDLDWMTLSNYFYFFKFFFGIVPYYTNYKHLFHLNVHYYNFFLQYHFSKSNLYNYLFIFINDIYYSINKSYIVQEKSDIFIEYIINDMNFFIEKKNTLGFFSLVDSVKFKLKFIDKNKFDFDYLLNIIKLKK